MSTRLWPALLLLASALPLPAPGQNPPKEQATPEARQTWHLRLRFTGQSTGPGEAPAYGDPVLRVPEWRSGRMWVVWLGRPRDEGDHDLRARAPDGQWLLYPSGALHVETRDRHPFGVGKGAGLGLVAGAALGALVMLALGPASAASDDPGDYFPEFTILPGAGLGLLAGAGFGALKKVDHWYSVPLRSIEPSGRWTGAPDDSTWRRPDQP